MCSSDLGMGTYGSRSLAVGGTAIVKALDKIIAKGRKIAAHLMEAAEADVEYDRGVYKVLTVEASVAARKSFGGTAPANVARAVKDARRRFL